MTCVVHDQKFVRAIMIRNELGDGIIQGILWLLLVA